MIESADAGIVERLEKATGPLDAKTEAALIAACNGWSEFAWGENVGDNGAPEICVWPKDAYSKHVNYNPWPSASIDAALTLVPEGWVASVSTGDPTRRISSRLPSATLTPHIGHDVNWQVFTKMRVKSSNGATPALALCIAALRARSART